MSYHKYDLPNDQRNPLDGFVIVGSLIITALVALLVAMIMSTCAP